MAKEPTASQWHDMENRRRAKPRLKKSENIHRAIYESDSSKSKALSKLKK